ncbi:MAG: acyltransferase family protein [Candidatus Heimdallarchaeota archaeon]|nr:MAG: acyltransferase family protein [Candidatus Heimdallarchaeota archaeon]
MSSRTESSQKPFYVYSVDLAKGIVLFFMIFGHALLWYDRPRAYAWDKGTELFLLFSNTGENTLVFFWLITIAFMVFPCFFYVYGFNAANSLLRQGPGADRAKVRSRSLRRAIVLFIVGSFGQSIMALIVSPGEVINYILTWNFFHLFGFTSLSFLVIFEVVWWLEKKGYDAQKLLVSILTGVLAVLLIIFIIFHDYWDPATAQHIVLSTKLDLMDIIKHALIDYGTTPIIPWFSFGLMGGIAATALNLTDPESSQTANRKAAILLVVGAVFYIIGGFFSLFIERNMSTPVEYPASTTFIFFTLGILTIFITSLLIIFDFDHITLNFRTKLKQLLMPLVIFGQLSLTIYFIHNVIFGIPIKMMFFYQNDLLFFIFMIFYSILFVIIAVVWRKKLKFKYTVEWGIRKFTS